MGLMKELAELNAIYQKMSTPDVDEAMIVTNADKKGNTPAYQNFKKGMKDENTKGDDSLAQDAVYIEDNDISDQTIVRPKATSVKKSSKKKTSKKAPKKKIVKKKSPKKQAKKK